MRVVSWFLSTLLILLVRAYQMLLSPIMPTICRFEPSCSHYFIQAVRLYGPMRGTWKGLGRICRCRPGGAGGFDPP
ncbi:MAG: membrane protein insertion efficiency factor YidD [Planctomycetota bacterium]|nr:membrane protein insertion efficiency factor YidD [Planctomycetota bacterium]